MNISPDQIFIAQLGTFTLNATIVFTWIVMAVLVMVSLLVTRNLSSGVSISRWQNFLEVLVSGIRNQIRDISEERSDIYLPFIGTLFLFILTSNILMVVPGYRPPTGSLHTTAALAICVFVAVPVFGVYRQGLATYFKHYIRPTPLMLPFNIIGEFSRTLALAIRLFGNIMSGTMLAAILLSVIPLIFPVFMDILGLLTGVIQAYIFAVLAMVYISSAARVEGTNSVLSPRS